MTPVWIEWLAILVSWVWHLLLTLALMDLNKKFGRIYL